MLELLKRINRDKFDITCCFYSDYSRAEGQTIGQVLNSIGIPLLVIPQRKQPAWAKLLKEAGRGLLFFAFSAQSIYAAYRYPVAHSPQRQQDRDHFQGRWIRYAVYEQPARL